MMEDTAGQPGSAGPAPITHNAWRDSGRPLSFDPAERAGLAAGLLALSAVFVQLVLGAWMRHSDAGLAIPDFPLAFGRLVPPLWTMPIAIHFAHRMGALVVAVHGQVPVAALRTMIYAYPTFHRGIEDALRSLADVP